MQTFITPSTIVEAQSAPASLLLTTCDGRNVPTWNVGAFAGASER